MNGQKSIKDIRPLYRDRVAELVPDVEVGLAAPQVPILHFPGVDKRHGMTKLIEAIDISKDEILFLATS